jgi:serine/threonine protein kinase
MRKIQRRSKARKRSSARILSRRGSAARSKTVLQAEGLPLDTRSDIYSFGAVLYEMVIGQRAFQGNSKISVLISILRDDPQPLGEKVADAMDGWWPSTRAAASTQIFVIAANGGPVRELTGDQFDSMLPSWSRDGKWIYFDSNRNGGRHEIFKCSPEGGEPVQVTHGGGWDAQESPDGAWLYFTRSLSANAPLLRMPGSFVRGWL